jgi:hypothetical protein
MGQYGISLASADVKGTCHVLVDLLSAGQKKSPLLQKTKVHYRVSLKKKGTIFSTT